VFCRAGLAALAIAICYRFEWTYLRYVTSELDLRFCSWMGLSPARIRFDTIAWGGQQIRYAVSCTFADVFCASVPLIWRVAKTVRQNLMVLTAFAACLFVLNILRLWVTNLLSLWGLDWSWMDQAVGGVFYFIVWRWLVRNGEWRLLSPGFQSRATAA